MRTPDNKKQDCNHDCGHDRRIIRDLAKRLAAVAADPAQEQRRELWRGHFSRRGTQIPVLVTYGMWNVWCQDLFGDHAMECREAFFRAHERQIRLELFHAELGDDYVVEPWLNQRATFHVQPHALWGLFESRYESDLQGGSWQFDPPLKTWDDMRLLVAPQHRIDEADTAFNVERLQDAVGDILEVNVDRSPVCNGFHADISTHLARLRGLEQMMLDMLESPAELHRLLAFMRDGILANQQAAEDAGDWSLADHLNQAVPYCDELPAPKANAHQASRSLLWGFCAAQEFTLISPAMHDEFLLQYQLPILRNFGLVHYGCCEDLGRKIRLLRQLPNLRSIAAAPAADLRHCAEETGRDYVISWRPNPTDMVGYGFNPGRAQRIIRDGLEKATGCHLHIHLKDVETVENEPGRLRAWVAAVRQVLR